MLFGVTGDLAYKMIFPALYAMVKSGALTAPVVGVAGSAMTLQQLRARARKSIREHGGIDDRAALSRLLALLQYVQGDYRSAETYAALKRALGKARHPAHYLAIPPVLFATVIEGLARAGLAAGARLIVEKPFGRDLETARVAQSSGTQRLRRG